MSLLQQIEKLGIPIADLAALTEQDLIRFEKRLKADVRLDDSLDLNEVLKIVDSLRKDKANIATLFHKNFEVLRDILKSEDKFVFHDKGAIIKLKFRDDFILFLNRNFEAELKAYVNRCLKENHYYGLHALLCYSILLSPELLNVISKRLEQKLDYMIESMSLNSEFMERKIESAMNPFFYRCLNRLGGIQFEDHINTLLNVGIVHVQNKRNYARLLFAQGSFMAIGDDLRAALSQNMEITREAGVREKLYRRKKTKGKGGTIIITYNTVGKVLRPGERRSKLLSFDFIAMVAVILFIVVCIIFSKSEPHNNRIIHTNTDSNEIQYNRAHNEENFVELINYLHSDTVTIIAQEHIPFNIRRTKLALDQDSHISDSKLLLRNETNRKLIVVANIEEAKIPFFYCLNPDQEMGLKYELKTLRIYSGEEPQIVDYINPRGVTLRHFRFNIFNRADKRNLEKVHTVNPGFNWQRKEVVKISEVDKIYRVWRE